MRPCEGRRQSPMAGARLLGAVRAKRRRARLVSCTLGAVGPTRLHCVRESRPDQGNVFSTGPMLRFRTSSSGPLGNIRSAERWVTSLPVNDPLAAQASIVTELHKLAARTARRTPAVLEAVFVVDTHADGLVRHLTTQYVEHASRSSKIEDQLWHALSDARTGIR